MECRAQLPTLSREEEQNGTREQRPLTVTVRADRCEPARQRVAVGSCHSKWNPGRPGTLKSQLVAEARMSTQLVGTI